MESIHTEQYKGYAIAIRHDLDAESPREWDNAGIMVCWHSRYSLGDKHDYLSPEEFLKYAERELDDTDEKILVMLPLHLLDHSGIRMSVRSFDHLYMGMDSGQVGWIYITEGKARREWGKDLSPLELTEIATKYLTSEVKIYNSYLSGEVYGYAVSDPQGEEVDSCWGFIGDMKYCIDEAKSVVDHARKARRAAKKMERETFAL